MIQESDEIQDDEWLLRRVALVRFRTDKTPIVSYTAFEPRLPKKSRDPDISGISLYRFACLSSAKDILRVDQIQNHAIVGFKVSELKSLGLTVVNEPEPITNENRINGHVVIPEISCENYMIQKSELRIILNKLAEIASGQDHIFWQPELNG